MKTLKHTNHIQKVYKLLLLLIFLIPGIHLLSAITFDRVIEYKNVTFDTNHDELDGYKIAFITDTHDISKEKLEKIVEKLNRHELNLLALGGDYTTHARSPVDVLETLSKVVTTDGIYGVNGNHDNVKDLETIMKQYGIRFLCNTGIQINDNFYLAGTNDLWNNGDIQQSIVEANADDFVLLLTHNPDITMMQDTSSVDLILSGHTHGGQIRFFGLWAPALTMNQTITKHGQHFMSGLAESKEHAPVYTSNGTGTFTGVPRVFARPQVILITFVK